MNKSDKELRKFPKKLKFAKKQRGTFKIITNININKKKIFPGFIIKTLSAGFVKWKTLTEFLKVLKRLIKEKKNKVKIKINCYIDWPISRKPKGTRLGKGKGKVSPDDWVTRIPAGKVLITIKNLKEIKFLEPINKALKIFPMPCKILKF